MLTKLADVLAVLSGVGLCFAGSSSQTPVLYSFHHLLIFAGVLCMLAGMDRLMTTKEGN